MPSGQGEGLSAQFPIGGTAREREAALIRCNSGADGIVRMEEGKSLVMCIAGEERVAPKTVCLRELG